MTDAAGTPRIPLADGHAIPQIGLGVYQLTGERAPGIIGAALDAGYRAIDTASVYGNEAEVGRALAESDVAREQVFVTTKLWNDAQGYDSALRAFDESLGRLGIESVDLYLIHWPCPDRKAYVDTWRALSRLKQEGRARSIGVSNFTAEHLDRLIGETGIAPVLNQIELHPRFQQRALREVHARLGIVTQAWSPLGQAQSLDDPVLTGIARRHGRSPAQVVLRWHVENGVCAIPKSANPERIEQNLDVFGFALSPEDHGAIAGLDRPEGRIGPDPLRFG